MSETYTVSGSVTYPDGVAAVGVSAMAVDIDSGPDDPLGAMSVSPDGSFELSASASDLGGHQEGTPEIKLYLFRDGSLVHEEGVDVDPDATVHVTIERPERPSMEEIADTMCGMHHGMSGQRGLGNVSRDPFHPGHGRFGGPLDESARGRSVGESSVPAGVAFLGLPSGQAVARAMGVEPLSNEELGFDTILADHDQHPDTEAPLWYYVLAEARVSSGGDRLGPVGSRIVAETLAGLVESDPSSFLTVQPNWTPTLPAPNAGQDDFTVADLLEFAAGGDD
ncbi:uncharacterized protein Nmlp_2068 [Natronomonas moolapensis 8.8.11]|uniref:Uncharacterized protein n=1 Tax=Natronomonas moolapensis (strain DSM 18674 / CECT 7526 / JCM 14361 / 8.8.11) TaxID=268739 RepID=M1XQ52_NATM8|nr:hypothetical protein [Natronomonas moolapensis]CCQ36251.1 uncharacterized protein Nmlp_2068 [Natronomonas moolapensis 8.8.11]